MQHLKRTLSFLQKSPLAIGISYLYGGVIAARNLVYDTFGQLSYRADRPVISIGGIRVGGTGKTPAARLIGDYCQQKGHTPAFLSRGYGRTGKSYRIVKPEEAIEWEEIGDEPAMLHSALPRAWLGIGPKRQICAALLNPLIPPEAVYILDDGYQHRSMGRDLNIVCLHDNPFTDHLLPHGFLREPAQNLARAHVVLLIGNHNNREASAQLKVTLEKRFPGLAVYVLFQEALGWVNLATLKETHRPTLHHPVLVAGIARPERFLSLVEEQKIVPSLRMIFSDHHYYRTNDFTKTQELYLNGIITTEKDAVRLAKLNIVPNELIWYLKIALRFSDDSSKNEFFNLIDKNLSHFFKQRRNRSCD